MGKLTFDPIFLGDGGYPSLCKDLSYPFLCRIHPRDLPLGLVLVLNEEVEDAMVVNLIGGGGEGARSPCGAFGPEVGCGLLYEVWVVLKGP